MAAPHIIAKPFEKKKARRANRQRVETLVYTDLGPGNGGFPINISVEGMAFHGVQPLIKNQVLEITFKLPGMDEHVAGMAEIVWLNESRKGGALRFIDLPEKSRGLITHWISLQSQDGNLPKPPATQKARGEIKVETKQIGTAPVILLMANDANTKSQGKVQAKIIDAPAAKSTEPIEEPIETIIQAARPKNSEGKSKIKEAGSKQHSRSAKRARQLSRVPALLPSEDKKRLSTRSFGMRIGVPIVVLMVGGSIFWEFRGTLIPFTTNGGSVTQPYVQPYVQSTPVAEIAAPQQQIAAVDPPVAPVAEGSLDLTPVAMEENLSVLPPPPVSVEKKIWKRPAINPSPRVPISAHKFATPVVVPPAVATHAPTPAVVSASRELPSAAPNPVPERVNQPVIADPVKEQTPPAPAKVIVETVVSPTGSIEIIPDPYPSIRVQSDKKGRTSASGTSLEMGRLISKIAPVYPSEALQQKMEGKVKLHIIVSRDGMVEIAQREEGPTLLAEAALHAVQQWRFKPTLLGGTPIETEQDVTLIFRLNGR